MRRTGCEIAPAGVEGGGARARRTTRGATPWRWLHAAPFDGALILGTLTLALGCGVAIALHPVLLYPILLVNLWTLGYPHVIATFTRLCFDRASFAAHRHLVVTALPIVAAVTVLVAWQVGLWSIVTLYLYAQWWHYTRQSWGLSRAYRRKDGDGVYESGWLDQAVFWCIPVYGILNRSSEGHASFIGLDLWTLPVPGVVADGAGLAALSLVGVWAVRRIVALRARKLARAHTLYMLTHFTIFGIAYAGTDDITDGWLMVNIWHNSQYILFVWLHHRRRFRHGIDPHARVLSSISQPGRIGVFALVCAGVAGVVYGVVLQTIDWLLFAGVSATLVLYQIVNFHHYIVDAVIWKVRRPAAAPAALHAR